MFNGMKYKLHMFGIEMMENETKVFRDNNAVILNLSVLESILKNKNHSTNYNYVQAAAASGIALIYKVDTG